MKDVFVPPYSTLGYVNVAEQTLDYWHTLLEIADAHLDNTGERSVVYILDTAKEWLAEDLSKEGNKHAFDGTGQADDAGSHGHFGAGIVAAQANNIGVLGVAPDSLVIPVKGLHVSSGSYTWIIRCLDYIISHYTKVFKNSRVGFINMSFGGGAYEPLRLKLQECVNVGLIPIAAAGNTGAAVSYPGAWDDLCITVPALDSSSQPANFSARGPATDVSAYGVAVISTSPDNTYPRVSGTSFSAPMIAGVSALIGTKFSDVFLPAKANNKQLMEEHLKEFAKDILEPGEDDLSGAGVAVIPPYFEKTPGKPRGDDPDEPGKAPEKIKVELSGEITIILKQE